MPLSKPVSAEFFVEVIEIAPGAWTAALLQKIPQLDNQPVAKLHRTANGPSDFEAVFNLVPEVDVNVYIHGQEEGVLWHRLN